MSIFGLDDAEVTALVRAVGGDAVDDEPDREAVRDRFARATWSGIAEPGDRTAGHVIEALGVADALDAVVARWPAKRWAATVAGECSGGVVPDRVVSDGVVSEGEFEQAIARWQPRLKSEAVILSLRHAARYRMRLLTPDSGGWPSGLSDLGLHAPIALWVRGTDAALAALGRSVALVGARAATGYGEHVTMELSAGLVDLGYAIVSGAAYGIDGMAHRTALASHGLTVAFLAGGADRFYPSGHDALLTRIVDEGAVISELPCGQPPTRWRFLQRNRLIAAASQASVVVEAGWRSGSLNTAGHAATIGRPVGAVPGPVTSAASAGCHRLIRDYDATLVTTADDIVELLGAVAQRAEDGEAATTPGNGNASVIEPQGSAEDTRLLDAMSVTAPRLPHDIAARSGLSVADVQSRLGILELDGRVVERERGWIKKKPEAPGKPNPLS